MAQVSKFTATFSGFVDEDILKQAVKLVTSYKEIITGAQIKPDNPTALDIQTKKLKFGEIQILNIEFKSKSGCLDKDMLESIKGSFKNDDVTVQFNYY